MRVRMKTQISGTRDGEHWPARGGVIDLPEDEAALLIQHGMAEKVTGAGREERATAPDDAEQRGPIKVGEATVGKAAGRGRAGKEPAGTEVGGGMVGAETSGAEA